MPPIGYIVVNLLLSIVVSIAHLTAFSSLFRFSLSQKKPSEAKEKDSLELTLSDSDVIRDRKQILVIDITIFSLGYLVFSVIGFWIAGTSIWAYIASFVAFLIFFNGMYKRSFAIVGQNEGVVSVGLAGKTEIYGPGVHLKTPFETITERDRFPIERKTFTFTQNFETKTDVLQVKTQIIIQPILTELRKLRGVSEQGSMKSVEKAASDIYAILAEIYESLYRVMTVEEAKSASLFLSLIGRALSGRLRADDDIAKGIGVDNKTKQLIDTVAEGNIVKMLQETISEAQETVQKYGVNFIRVVRSDVAFSARVQESREIAEQMDIIHQKVLRQLGYLTEQAYLDAIQDGKFTPEQREQYNRMHDNHMAAAGFIERNVFDTGRDRLTLRDIADAQIARNGTTNSNRKNRKEGNG